MAPVVTPVPPARPSVCVRALFRVLARVKRGYTLEELLERVPAELTLGADEARHYLRNMRGNGYVRALADGGPERWQLTELSGRAAARALR